MDLTSTLLGSKEAVSSINNAFNRGVARVEKVRRQRKKGAGSEKMCSFFLHLINYS